jgi:hypothetical protein
MHSKKKILIGMGALAALLAAGPVAAQVAQDFPNLKGTNSRVGRNGDPAGSSPGVGNLRWFTPNGLASTATREYPIDDTDLQTPDTAPDGFPYPVNPAGYAVFTKDEATAAPNDGWTAPIVNFVTGVDQAAEDARLVQVRARPDNGNPRNTQSRLPYYRYTRATPSDIGNNPLDPAVPAQHRTFQWNFTLPDSQPGQYALYVYLPVQRTRLETPAPGEPRIRTFPQRYYVYDIQFAGNQHRTEIVDSYASGGGWVRLGAGGLRTGAVFGYDGVNPIRITLHNTVPRDSNGKLLLTDGVAGPQDMLVYADSAMAVPQPGSYAATPTSARRVDGTITSTVVTAASNQRDTGVNTETGDANNITNAEVTNYDYQNGQVRWRFSPIGESGKAIARDNTGAASVSGAHPWETNVAFPHLAGVDAQVAPVNTTVPDSSATYTFPVTDDGSYAVWVYIPAAVPARALARAAQYEVETISYVNGTPVPVITPVTLNQDAVGNGGWVRLGGRFYHDAGPNTQTPTPIRVRVLNASADPADHNGARYVYADAIRIVGEANLAVTSSPVHATALIRPTRGAAPVETKVVIVADERGVIHCLDSEGNGNGTTREYWSYPSIRDTVGYDPNLGPITGSTNAVSGEDWSGPGNTPAADRVPTAEMPSGFDLSTALVQRVQVTTPSGPENRDYLYIASSNGRVYCIDMAGRGDGDGTPDPESNGTRAVGTTTRVWTYPSTYPSANAVPTSNLGTFRGSLAISEVSPGTFTLFVPATQGRMYALNALGNATTKTTTVRWTFPALNQPTLGPIMTTPSVEFGRVYFGTSRKFDPATGEQPGQFIALNQNDGTVAWSFARNDTSSTAGPDVKRTDDFQSSPITVPAGELGGTDPNTVFALNQNRVLYAFDADTGAVRWVNDELQSGATASLGFTRMLAYDNFGAQTTLFPVILVPTDTGTFAALFANRDTYNRSTDTVDVTGQRYNNYRRLAWFYTAEGDSIVSSMAVSNGWMYGADTRGFLYAWNNGTGLLVDGDVPGSQGLPPNDPRGDIFRKAKVRLISQATYRSLRRPEDDPLRGKYGPTVANAKTFTRDVFEWGETAYVLVYDFPYLYEDNRATPEPVDPPVVNISFAADGRTVRGVAVQSRCFDTRPGTPTEVLDTTVPNYESVAPLGPLPGVTDNPRMNGYAILAFPLQNGGQSAVPPGSGEITVNIQTSALSGNGTLQTVALDPHRYDPAVPDPPYAWSRLPFQVANPLAILVPDATGNRPAGLPTTGVPYVTASTNYTLGVVNNPGALPATSTLKQEALLNASVDLPGSGGKFENLLGTATKRTPHGTNGKAKVWVIDRSYMALLRPGGQFGLDNVRVDRRDLGRQGGAAGVIKSFDPTLYANFEDLPVNYPNNSLDYPDIARERIRVTKEPNGSAENPLYSGVALRAPRTNTGDAITEDTPPQNRRFVATEFEIDVDVPKYQPAGYRDYLASRASAALVRNSGNGVNEQGYIGRFQVYVDSVGNGQFDAGQREAFRSINLSTAVDIDERLVVTTPNVDLGSLAGGTGYSPREVFPGTLFRAGNDLAAQTDLMHPWLNGTYRGIFREFGVVNDGNVNMLNLRIAKRSQVDSATILPLAVNPTNHDPLAWLNGQLNVHSDIDLLLAPVPAVILQKARVTDRVPTALKANPTRRENPNLGTTGARTIPGQTEPVQDVLNESLIGPAGARQLKFPPGNPRLGVSVPIGFPVGKYGTQVVVYEDGPTTGIWNNRDNTAIVPGGREAYTEPGVFLTFNVVETRLTNTYTPLTAPMIDNLAPTADPAALRFQNLQPSAVRDANGGLVVAWASNRTGWTAGATAGNFTGQGTRLYLATLDSGGNFSPSGMTVNTESAATGSRLRDLGFWRPSSASQWFAQGAANYPTGDPNGYFGGGVIASSVRYDSPTFPTAGFMNPFSGSALANAKLAFVGRATRQTGAGQVEESRLMVSGVTTNASGRISGMSGPFVMANDPQIAKSEPSVLQTADDSAILFYTGVTAGQTGVYYVRYQGGAFGPSSALPFGRGFLSVSGLSASGRNYTGARASGDPASRPIAEMVFTGQLRGRPYPEAFVGRARVETNGGLPENADGTLRASDVFEYLPGSANEPLEREGSGIFRTRGVVWQRNANVWQGQPIELFQMVNGVKTELLIPNTRVFDNETGLISYESRLGGRVTIDPSQGTIRFTNASPTGSSRLYATYVPRFLRLSQSANQGGGAARATAMYDQRFISDSTYWRLGNGNFVQNEPITNDRLVLMWNRAASGNLTARPFLSSMRFGINLPTRLPTLPDGTPGYRNNAGTAQPAVLSVNVVGFGPVDAYQIDPANGRIYLPQAYEGYEVEVVHAGVDQDGNVIAPSAMPATRATVGYVTERAQEPVPIETAVNESNLGAFLDPFNYQNDRRPPLVWLFWTSTRGGVSDIFFETIAPQWNPVPITK